MALKPGFPKDKPSTFHLKLEVAGADQEAAWKILGGLEYDLMDSEVTRRSKGENRNLDSNAFIHKERR